MKLWSDPTQEEIAEAVSLSKDRAARWLKDLDTGTVYYWPSDTSLHAPMAVALKVARYEKGIAVLDDEDREAGSDG